MQKKRNKANIILLIIMFCIFLPLTTMADDYKEPNIKVIAFKNLITLQDNPLKIDKKVYLPVRNICELLGAKVSWDSSSNTVMITKNSTVVKPKIKLINGKAYAASSIIEDLFGYKTIYYDNYNVLTIDKKADKTTWRDITRIIPSYKNYSEEDLVWLARIVHAEACGENYTSKLAVANVIINRKKSSIYPNSIKEVIFDRKSGVQFTPIQNGSINNNPSEHSYLAALEALEGRNNSANALFFINPRIATSSWVSRNRVFAFAMGNHNFYY